MDTITRNHYGAIPASDGTFKAVMVDAAGHQIILDEGFPTEDAAEQFAEAIYRQDLDARLENAGAATVALLAEGVAVVLFLATFALWTGIAAGRI